MFIRTLSWFDTNWIRLEEPETCTVPSCHQSYMKYWSSCRPWATVSLYLVRMRNGPYVSFPGHNVTRFCTVCCQRWVLSAKTGRRLVTPQCSRQFLQDSNPKETSLKGDRKAVNRKPTLIQKDSTYSKSLKYCFYCHYCYLHWNCYKKIIAHELHSWTIFFCCFSVPL